jgi:hypothetical protein
MIHTCARTYIQFTESLRNQGAEEAFMHDDGEGQEVWGGGGQKRFDQRKVESSMHRFMEVEGIGQQRAGAGGMKHMGDVSR